MSRLSKDYLAEKDFLLKFAVDSYNKKYGRKLDYKTCRIKSVQKAFGYVYGYQVETMRSDDHVVIMLYFNLGELTRDHLVRVEVQQNMDVAGALGDEVYVVTGEVAKFYKEQGIYKFYWIRDEGFNFTTVVWLDGDMFQFMDGTFLNWMGEEPAPPFPPVASV